MSDIQRIINGLKACRQSVAFRIKHGPVVRSCDGSIETPEQAGAEVLKGYLRNRPANSYGRLMTLVARMRT
ncbi:hypothetical protein [Caudoviricetes sp.]|nr:hypothetical protein [Caudoviricetes sp.]